MLSANMVRFSFFAFSFALILPYFWLKFQRTLVYWHVFYTCWFAFDQTTFWTLDFFVSTAVALFWAFTLHKILHISAWSWQFWMLNCNDVACCLYFLSFGTEKLRIEWEFVPFRENLAILLVICLPWLIFSYSCT